MKTKVILLACIFIFSISKINAQSSFYAGFRIGYGLPIAGSIVGFNSENNNPANTSSMEAIYGSYAKGFDFGAYGGYNINDDVALELGVNYLMGSKYKFTDNSVNSPNVTDNSSDEIFAHSLRINPALRIEFGEGKISPYMRGGLLIGLMNKVTDKYTETFTSPGTMNITNETSEYTGGVGVGFSGALGMNISLTDKMFLFAELADNVMSWAPAKRDFTEVTLNGADQLASMTTDEKHFEYVDRVNQSMNTSSAQPTQRLKFYFPMSSFGLNVGLHFVFGE